MFWTILQFDTTGGLTMLTEHSSKRNLANIFTTVRLPFVKAIKFSSVHYLLADHWLLFKAAPTRITVKAEKDRTVLKT